MRNEAFEAAKANALDIMAGAFRGYTARDSETMREEMGPCLHDRIVDAIANALVLVQAGLRPKPGELAALPLPDFLEPARILNDSVRVLGVFAAPEWAELSQDGQDWLAAILRETLAHVPGELERLREEVAYWRADLAARLLFDTGMLEAARQRGDDDAAGALELRLRSSLAAYRAAEAGEWRERCDICGEMVLPGEPTLAGEEVSGHWRCLSDDAPAAVHDLAPGEDLKARVARAQAVLNAPPEPPAELRPLMVPCPHCADGFTTHGDRHARTAKDVCSSCGGTHKVPAATGTSPETSAPPVNENATATPGKDLHETGKFLPPDENETAPAGSFLDPLPVLYRNWNGIVRVRQLAPTISPAGTLTWCPQDQWHGAGWRVRCHDAEADHRRMYPLEGILAWGQPAIDERMRERAAARTLEESGYTFKAGAEFWKPPLGQAPDFEAQGRRRELASKVRELNERNPRRDFDEQLLLDEAARALEAVPLRNRP